MALVGFIILSPADGVFEMLPVGVLFGLKLKLELLELCNPVIELTRCCWYDDGVVWYDAEFGGKLVDVGDI